LVGDPGVLNRVGCAGVAELPLNCCDIAGYIYKVSAQGVFSVMGRVALDAGRVAYFVEHRIYHPGIQPTVAVGVGISKLIDFVLYFYNNDPEFSKKNFPMHRLIVKR
jgi:hypothetical protein